MKRIAVFTILMLIFTIGFTQRETTGCFFRNAGQFPQLPDGSSVDFAAWTSPANIYFAGDRIWFHLYREVDMIANETHPFETRSMPQFDYTDFRLRFEGANPDALTTGLQSEDAVVNFVGKNNFPGLRLHQGVEISDLYPDIDLKYYMLESGGFKYDLIVQPKGSPSDIILDYEGTTYLKLDSAGNLLIGTQIGELTEVRPYVYQLDQGRETEIPSSYKITGNKVSFEIGAYDPNIPLIIDPLTLKWSTYSGGTSSNVSTVSVVSDASGNLYYTGSAYAGFPTTAGAFNTINSSSNNSATYVMKTDSSGNLIWSTFVCGANPYIYSVPDDIALCANGDIVCGTGTYAANWPTTTNCFDSIKIGSGTDNVVFKLNSNGTAMLYATYIGGRDYGEFLTDVKVKTINGVEYVYLAGSSSCVDYPVTTGAFMMSAPAAYPVFTGTISILNMGGNGPADLIYSTWIGGTLGDGINDLWITDDNELYFVGGTYSVNFPVTPDGYQLTGGGAGNPDAVIGILEPKGLGTLDLKYSTYFGGSNYENASDIEVDVCGKVYIAGETGSADLPVGAASGTPFQSALGGSFDFFILVADLFNSPFLQYSTFLGGTGDERAMGMQINPATGDIFFGGNTSGNFPVTGSAVQPLYGGGSWDYFAGQLRPAGTGNTELIHATYFGGSADDGYFGNGGFDLYQNRLITMCNSTRSTDWPVTAGAMQSIKMNASNSSTGAIFRMEMTDTGPVLSCGVLNNQAIYLTALAENKGISLSWSLENPDPGFTGFEVLRGSDPTDISDPIIQTHTTQVIDAEAVSGEWYYQIKGIQSDGSVIYSNIISVRMEETEPQVWPGLLDPYTALKVNISGAEPLQMKIYNVEGKLIAKDLMQPGISVAIPAGQLKQGVYFIQLSSSSGMYHFKVIAE